MDSKERLSEDTLQWLSAYNGLSEEEQKFLSYIPADIREFLGISGGDTAAMETNAAEEGTPEDSEETTEGRAIPRIEEELVSFEGLPENLDFEAVTKGMETLPEGEPEVYGGSPGTAYTVVSGDFTFFYFQLEGEASFQNMNYAITGENVVLSCGIHVGMPVSEAEKSFRGFFSPAQKNRQAGTLRPIRTAGANSLRKYGLQRFYTAANCRNTWDSWRMNRVSSGPLRLNSRRPVRRRAL